MRFHVIVRLLFVLWVITTVHVFLRLWSRSDGDDAARLISQPHKSHTPDVADHDPVLPSVAEINASTAEDESVFPVLPPPQPVSVNRTGWRRYFKYQATGDGRIWPTTSHERDDRILNQIHLTHQDTTGGTQLKKILLVNGFLDFGLRPGQKRFIDQGCPVNQCTLTGNKEDATTADVILFDNGIVRQPTHQRPPHQIWVVFMLENPTHTPDLIKFDGQMNWTATYRLDSTLVTPYERFKYFNNYAGRLPEHAPRDVKASKSRHVAWFASNCQAANGRHNYVKELQKYIDVDVYGSCGRLKCYRLTEGDKCNKILRDDYHFYLSFENHNCRDYITEKLFRNALLNDVVPVVMGAPRADYERAAPPDSFIHVDDFASPRELADFLRAVAADRDRYNSYFRWHGVGEYIDTKFWCRLCAMLHESHRTGQHSVYDRLNGWWRGRGVCLEAIPDGLQWMSWRGVDLPDILNTTHHRQWTERTISRFSPS